MTDLQLDAWTELIYKKADQMDEDLSYIDVIKEPYKYGLKRGYKDGLIMSIVIFGMIENDKRSTKEFREIKEKLIASGKYTEEGSLINKEEN